MIQEGTGLKRRPLPDLPQVSVEEPRRKATSAKPYHVLMPGVGGTGVVTINALLATAALVEGKYTTTLDQTGLAQKGGAVVSHLTIAEQPVEESNRISYGASDLLLGFDAMGAAAASNLQRVDPGRTSAVINSHEIPTNESIRKGITVLSIDGLFGCAVRENTREGSSIFLDASECAESLFGSHLQTNIFLLGVAYQAGLLPLRAESIEQSIALNGVQVDRNLAAFNWGRQYVADRSKVDALVSPRPLSEAPRGLDEQIDFFAAELSAYQNAAYAERYRRLVDDVRAAERRVAGTSTTLSAAVARYFHKLLAHKDEYEVARLLTLPELEQQIAATFEAPVKRIYHLHPPLLRAMGLKQKLSLGPWSRPFLKTLAALKSLRGTPLDFFGYAHLRREERALIAWYEDLIRELLPSLTPANIAAVADIACLPDRIRGYEQIKLDSIDAARQAASEMRTRLSRPVAA